MPEEGVKVAVRVRPFNQREKDRKANLMIKMSGQMTSIANPETPNEEPKKFSFDYSYWSHDGMVETSEGILQANPGSNYASQRKVFEDLGQGVLDNAFEGYNCSLFAYGQTGSGKSYSMVGYGANRGIVPITCDELFKTMATNADANKRFEVTFSMLEIYNEQVRDLLSRENPKGGLQVRQNPKLGLFYVESLKKVPVGSYAEIEKRMDQGTANRTVASTNMNATSSRAHTVVSITFDQIIKSETGSETKKSSVMNLVDLAGSERADSTGATGDRLKEGANINKSLSALGNVISALADLSTGSKKKIVVPYRDSVLTKLLQNALGGNSKTIMIAALSPADINYDETLSTLRYADRAKKIKNKAVINENPMDKLIRELKEENDRLKKAMEGGGMIEGSAGMSPEELTRMKREMEEEIRAQLMANQAMLMENDSKEDWDAKLRAAQSETEELKGAGSQNKRRSQEPYLINLNEDPMLSGVICHFLDSNKTTVGRKDAQPLPDVCLSGLSIQKLHAVITNKNGNIEISPAPGSASKTKVNGLPLNDTKVLSHKDRILFGSNHMYVMMNPKRTDTADKNLPNVIDWDFAQKEIAEIKGFATHSLGLTKDQLIAQEQVLELLPMVSEVNAVSEELNKRKSFEVVLISAAAQEGIDVSSNNGTRVMVKMTNLLNSNTWLWQRGKFLNRRYLIQDLYQRFLDGDDLSNVSKEEDPFWEPPEEVLIGTANAFLQSLSYALDFDDELMITDYKGQEEGTLNVNVAPCDAKGKTSDEENFVEDPNQQLNKPFYFKVIVRKAEINKSRFSKGVRVQFALPFSKKKEPETVQTPIIKNSLSPQFNYEKVVSIDKVQKKHLDFFEHRCLTFYVYGLQEDTLPEPNLSKLTTRELRQRNSMKENADTTVRRKTLFGNDIASDQSHLKAEVVLLQRKHDRLVQKERRIQEICKEWEKKQETERQFEPFYRAVSAAAFSTGTRLKTRVQMLNQENKVNGSKQVHVNDDDTVSLFVFGEEENELATEAEKNAGVVPYYKVAKHHYADLPLHSGKSYKEYAVPREPTQHSSLGDRDSLASVDLAPYMNNSDSKRSKSDSSIAKTYQINNNLTNNKPTGGGQKRPTSAGGNRSDGSKACVIQ